MERGPQGAERSRLRVLYLSDVYFPRVNGVSTSIATFRRELAQRGVDVPLLCPAYDADGIERAPAAPAASLSHPGRPAGRIVRLAGLRVPFDPEDRWVPAHRFRAAAAHTPDFDHLDLIHIQTPFAAHRAGVDLARRRGVPVVETYHTYFEHYFEHYLPFLPASVCRRLARRLTLRAARELDRMVVPSTAMRDALGEYGVTTPMSVIPTGIRPDSLGVGDGARFRARHAIAADRPVLVHVGRIGHEKNLLFLLQAFERVVRALPSALLIVAGEGPARAELQRAASALGLNGHLLWLGYLDRERELADCYRGGDAFVFTSKTETQGLVLLEAMALGVPVVALAEMGTRDLLLERRGALVAEENLDDFAGKCLELLRDPALRARLAAEGPQVAADWSAGRMAARLEGLYDEMLA
ncbi:MAG: glycosyltransferase [Thermoanaerobaculia bacterium]|nr:glycosyltransferase [Thermoanaerobaculia bacterium]